MLIAKENSERIPPMPEGMYEAVCTMLIDMGVQNNPRFGTSSRKIRLVWEVLGQTVKIGDQEYPRQISKEFTNSLSDKSNLRKALQSWRGKSFTPQELKGFDLRKVLGAGAVLQVMHKTGENGDYANIETIIPMVGKKPPAVKPVVFDLDDAGTYPTFQSLPRYIQEGIAKSEGFEFTGLTVAPKNNQTQPPLPDDSSAPPVHGGGMYPPVSDQYGEPPVGGFYDIPDQMPATVF